MNALVIHFSMFGNTKQVAEAVAESLESEGAVRVMPVDQLSVADLDEVDLVVMGSPTHRMNLPQALRPVFDALPPRALRDTRVAAYDTSYKMSWWLARFTAARKLDRKLRKLGGKRVVPPETFHVTGREGPLCDGEIERAKVWSESILERLRAR
jgi:flavodoxin